MSKRKTILIGLMTVLGLTISTATVNGFVGGRESQKIIHLARGDSALVDCPVRMIPQGNSAGTHWTLVCPLGNTATPSPVVTRTATPTRTASPIVTISPTITRTLTITPTQTPTVIVSPTVIISPTSVGGDIQPFASALLCVDSDGDLHSDVTDSDIYGLKPDNILFHDLWNEKAGCHYNHTHNDNPSLGDSVFGETAQDWDQQLSYAWLTPNENNEMGHQGYKYYVNMSPNPTCSFEGYAYLNPQNCVSAFRIQYHDAGGNAHMVKRFHSYYMEVQIKKGAITGYIKTGGWADFGCLHKSYKESFLPLVGIDPVQPNGNSYCGSVGGQSIHADPYRGFGNTWAEIQGQTTGDNFAIWTSHDRYDYNNFGYFFFRTLDSWGAIDASDPYVEHFLCPAFDCKFNNSEHNVFNVFMIIPTSLDTNGDGIVNYTGYTDVKGNIVQGCIAPSATCVPLQIVNAPVGNAIWSRNTSGLRPEGDPIREHDIYFNGQPSGWITFHPH